MPDSPTSATHKFASCNCVSYYIPVLDGVNALIKTFRDEWLRSFYINDKTGKRIPGSIRDRLFRKLQLIDDATSNLDLRSPPGNHFEKLSGHLAGIYSIRVNNQWRLLFEWDEKRGEALRLYLDNHDYR